MGQYGGETGRRGDKEMSSQLIESTDAGKADGEGG
jgi:hypothetical protein